ncbi:phage minor tail U family protein [Klebsiella sp. PL-2018]|uniref:phage minor tail U family protein n=1 Tax=Klebsiella sp. PL-2018 TaxID=2851540 RepID=UPI001C22ADED|nr:phage minor tail U family protein [Klebsiella sp. PL-2018]QXC99320.1 Phage minor tail protein [Klebsiella sp. PL-2018]
MSKHSGIRAAVINHLKEICPDKFTVIDGLPVFVEQSTLPAFAVYLTEAQYAGQTVDADDWEAVLHVQVFLKASKPDSELDQCVEDFIYPAVNKNEALGALVENIYPIGYDYTRDDEMAFWGSADLTFKIEYTM